MKDLKNQEISNILLSLATLKHYDFDCINMLINEVKQRITKLNNQDISNILWSLAVFRHRDNMIIEHIKSIKSDNKKEIRQVYQASLIFDFEVLRYDIMSNIHISESQKIVYKIVNNILIDNDMQNYTLTEEYQWNHMSLDIFLKINDQKIVIDVNGPSHYCNNVHQKTGNQILKENILRMHGFHIIEVDLTSWELDTSEFCNYLEREIISIV
jgi:hypothetical protein